MHLKARYLMKADDHVIESLGGVGGCRSRAGSNAVEKTQIPTPTGNRIGRSARS
jgi:hypothetical protein